MLVAQEASEEDKSYLTRLIEDNLSGDERTVTLVGFEGALSSEARIASLTVADSDGVWLTLEDVVLSWNRAALLTGAIDVQELGAERIILARPPLPGRDLPTAEAQPFALPDLPVSIDLEKLAIGRVELGPDFLGEPLAFGISGNASLSGGEGGASLLAERLDGPRGRFDISGSFVNETRFLDLSLDLSEDPGGIVAQLLDLPGAPAIALTVNGAAPLDAFAAELTLATEGVDRITGAFAVRTTEAGSGFALDVGGDVTPLFDPAYRTFFGQETRLTASGGPRPDGGFLLTTLQLEADTLRLEGSANIDPDGWPETLVLQGRISGNSDSAVLLPLVGPETYVEEASVDLQFDRSVSDRWNAQFVVAELSRPGLAIAETRVLGNGRIDKESGDVDVSLTYAAEGLMLDDVGAAMALGQEIEGALDVVSRRGAPIRIETFTLDGPGLTARADGTLELGDPGPKLESNLVLNVESLERFSQLASRDLAGQARLGILASLRPLDGMFDVILSGTTRDIGIGEKLIDPLLAGEGSLSMQATRDTEGTRVSALRIATDEAEITGDATLTNDGGRALIEASLREVGLIVPTLNGPIALDAIATIDGERQGTLRLSASAPAATLTAEISMDPAAQTQTLNGQGQVRFGDLAAYQDLLGQPLSGRADVSISGVLLGDGVRFDADISAQTTDLQTGIAQLDPLLIGSGQVDAQISRVRTDRSFLGELSAEFQRVSATAAGSITPEGISDLQADVILPQIGIVAPGLDGQGQLSVIADRGDGPTTAIELLVAAPATRATVVGQLAAPEDGYGFTGETSVDIADLAPFQTLIGRPMRGAIVAQTSGLVTPDLSAIDLTVDLRSRDLGTGIASADKVLRGEGRLTGRIGRRDGVLEVSDLRFETPNVQLSADLEGQGETGSGRFRARLADVGLFTDTLSGPVTAEGNASRLQNGWNVDVVANGPGGIAAQTTGSVSDAGQLDLRLSGGAPLGLGNTLLAPRRIAGDARFDLAIVGPPALGSISGTVSTDGARLAAPTLGQALDGISGGATLDGGRANLDLRANVQTGGAIAISGPIDLNPPNIADISIDLSRVVLRDPTLYETTVDGTIGVRGALAGGAQVSGLLRLGETNVQVPSSAIGALGELPQVTHVGASAAVRQTLTRADAREASNVQRSATGPRNPIDLTIDAPSRIFIRGRGLDAELGGRLRLGGDSNSIVPVGQFDLVRGRLDILQQRFALTEGSASLQGDFEPYVRLVAQTEAATGTRIEIIVEGPASAPDIRFVSVPELPQDEVISQLIFGRNLTEISPLQAVQLASAVATLAGRGGTSVIDSFRQNVGLDDFDVTTDEAGNAALRAGKYLSDNVYTDVTVSSDGSTEINLNLNITDEITAKGTAGADGETSIGIFFERDY